MTPAIQPKNQLQYLRWKERPQFSHPLPELHQRRSGDVAPPQVEDLIRTIVAMQSNPAAAGGHMQRELGPIIIGLVRGHYGRIRHVLFPDAAESITDETPAAGQLEVGIHVLELTPTTLVSHVVRTARLDAVGGTLDDLGQAASRVALVLPEVSDLDQVAWRGARHEHRSPVVQLADSITTRRQTENPDRGH
jgi:hypothetical protein